jgi:Protein of unknown function (DUF416)
MANQELKSLDDYEIFLTEKMTPWSPQRRSALAAAIAEHWLPAYESFSAEEDWGDPASLRRSLDAIWNHVQGRELTARDVARHNQQIEEITPHMDDFDAEEALTACAAVKEALRTCGDDETRLPTREPQLSASSKDWCRNGPPMRRAKPACGKQASSAKSSERSWR